MCVSPILLKTTEIKTSRNHFTTPVPCGRCPQCAKAKVYSWLFRIQEEMKISSNPLFITLTYDNINVPITDNGLLSLVKRDCQLWLKRLRKEYAKHSDKQIRYYLVGEYGTRTKRPHYHCIMFNMDLPELVGKTWCNGFDFTLPVKDGGIEYVLKYLHKQKPKRLDSDDRQPEFSLMSKRLGANYLTPERIRFHNQSPEFSYLRTDEGFKMSLPKYYKDKLYGDDMRAAVTCYLSQRAENALDEQIDKIYRNDLSVSKERIELNIELSKLHSKFAKRKEVL